VLSPWFIELFSLAHFLFGPKQIKKTHEGELDSTLALSSRIFVRNNLVKRY
jgi:hypothetical protein